MESEAILRELVGLFVVTDRRQLTAWASPEMLASLDRSARAGGASGPRRSGAVL